jgi:transposase
LETLAEAGALTLFYGDESHVCQQGYVPYGWQFPGEDVFIPAQTGVRLNCWGLFSRDNQCHWASTCQNITAAFVAEKLDALSLQIGGPTVIVLDNASIHKARLIQQRRASWAQRDLHLFFLPPYSPHLNLAETVWRHLKGGWLQPQDYAQADDLAYATNHCLANFGKQLLIMFSPFNAN